MARSRKSTPVLDLERFSEYLGVEKCLMIVARALAKAGSDEDDLLPYQRQLFRDLADPLDEQALAEMHNYWDYDLDVLTSRRRGYEPEGIPAKPRIEVFVEITSKGNLKVEWFPVGYNRWGEVASLQRDSDFTWWRRYDNRGASYDTRPSNELLFLRGFKEALTTARDPTWRHWLKDLDAVLIRGCEAAIERLKQRLERHFDVRYRMDLFLRWESESDIFSRVPPRLIGSEIADPAEKKAEAERAELEALPERAGFSVEELLQFWTAETARHDGAPTPPPAYTLPNRLCRAIKRQGIKTTKGQIERALRLVRDHYPERVAEAEGRASEADSKVVRLAR